MPVKAVSVLVAIDVALLIATVVLTSWMLVPAALFALAAGLVAWRADYVS